MQFIKQHEIELINHTICHISHRNELIEYVVPENVHTRKDKLHVLTYKALNYTTTMDIATYYMKNIIVLQCFPDGNHRTALESVRLFFYKNDINFRWNPEYVVKYQRNIYKLRYKMYETYEELPISVLDEPLDSLWIYCHNCIENNLP